MVELVRREKVENGKTYVLTDYIFTDLEGDRLGITAHREMPYPCAGGCDVKLHWSLSVAYGGVWAATSTAEVEMLAWLIGRFSEGHMPTVDEAAAKYMELLGS